MKEGESVITAGIDVGVETTKAVVMRDDAVIGRAKVPSGGYDRPERALEAYMAALENAGMAAKAVDAVTATGRGKYDVPFAAHRITETIAAVRAGAFLVNGATSVLSVGADECIAATIGEKRPVDEFVLNQKCTAGLGTFMQVMSGRLEMPLEVMAETDTGTAPNINQGCTVFAELDALSLLNGGAAAETVAAACIKAAAVRAATVLRDLTAPRSDRTALIGGMAKNRAFVRELEKRSGIGFFIPCDAEYAGAIGAAICSRRA